MQKLFVRETSVYVYSRLSMLSSGSFQAGSSIFWEQQPSHSERWRYGVWREVMLKEFEQWDSIIRYMKMTRYMNEISSWRGLKKQSSVEWVEKLKPKGFLVVSDVGKLDTGLHCGSVEEVMKYEPSEETGCEEKGRSQASSHYWHLKPTELVAQNSDCSLHSEWGWDTIP